LSAFFMVTGRSPLTYLIVIYPLTLPRILRLGYG